MMDLFPEKLVLSWYDKLINDSKKVESKWVRNLMFPTANKKYGYKKSWYENSIELEFEGVKLFGMKHYDEYLKFKYGDYMKIPPVKNRKIHPVSKIKFF